MASKGAEFSEEDFLFDIESLERRAKAEMPIAEVPTRESTQQVLAALARQRGGG